MSFEIRFGIETIVIDSNYSVRIRLLNEEECFQGRIMIQNNKPIDKIQALRTVKSIIEVILRKELVSLKESKRDTGKKS